jgi:hypothetical protein
MKYLIVDIVESGYPPGKRLAIASSYRLTIRLEASRSDGRLSAIVGLFGQWWIDSGKERTALTAVERIGTRASIGCGCSGAIG